MTPVNDVIHDLDDQEMHVAGVLFLGSVLEAIQEPTDAKSFKGAVIGMRLNTSQTYQKVEVGFNDAECLVVVRQQITRERIRTNGDKSLVGFLKLSGA